MVRHLNHGKKTLLKTKLYVYTCTHTGLMSNGGEVEVSVLETYEDDRDEHEQLVVAGLPTILKPGDGKGTQEVDVDMGEAFLLSYVVVGNEIKYAHIMRLKTGEIFTELWIRVHPTEKNAEKWLKPTEAKASQFGKWF